MKKIKDIQVEWVNHLPRVNLRDTILATPEAARLFQTDLKEFFPLFMERYFLPRALRVSTCNRLYVFQGPRAARYLQTPRLRPHLPLPRDPEGQCRVAQHLFSAVDGFSGLTELLTKNAREHFHAASFMAMKEKPFSLEEYLLALNRPEKHRDLSATVRASPARPKREDHDDRPENARWFPVREGPLLMASLAD